MRPFCGFWKRFKNDNSYWKIVYCRETKHNKKTKIVYEDVPTEIPWKQNENIEEEKREEDESSSVVFETESSFSERSPPEEETDIGDENNFPINRLPTVYKPRGYPFVKRQQEEGVIDSSSFEYFMNTSHRDSFNSGRNLYSDDNSIYTITTETNESASEACSISEDDDKNNKIEQESKFRTIGRSFIRKLASEKTRVSRNGDKSRKTSNNNTVQQFYTINELKTDDSEDVSVTPVHNDVIFMDQSTNSLSFKDDLWKRQKKTTGEANLKQDTKEDKKTRGNSINTYNNKNEDSKKLYGLSTSMFPRTVSTSAPEPKTSPDSQMTSIGLIDKDRKTNIFYSA